MTNPILTRLAEDFPTEFGLPKIAPPEALSDQKAVDVLAALDMCIECFGSTEECPDDTACIDEIKQARAAVAELQRLVLAIDAECGNSKPDFAKVCALASEAAALSK